MREGLGIPLNATVIGSERIPTELASWSYGENPLGKAFAVLGLVAEAGFPPVLGPTLLHTGEEPVDQVLSKLKEEITRIFDVFQTVFETAGVSPDRIITAYTIGSSSRRAQFHHGSSHELSTSPHD